MKSDEIETAVQNVMSHNFTLDDSVSWCSNYVANVTNKQSGMFCKMNKM